eukprot:TRINITY_DN6429_c0_g1_i6.p1 TRINITY_DN6429_c0_g1~~TRINITY_DN6429_c0_g1_i6.p1  ORF type:complete len:433 (+),score=85.99 TRINITY_DN6429_c0_g1_i6:69-1367(+)
MFYRLSGLKLNRGTQFRFSTVPEPAHPEVSVSDETNPLAKKRRSSTTTRRSRDQAPVNEIVVVPPTGRKLFTTGTQTTSPTVRFSMLKEYGSREPEFINLVKSIKEQVLQLGGFGEEFDLVVMQGSELYSVEAVISQTTPPEGKILVISNGTDGRKLSSISQCYAKEVVDMSFGLDEQVDVEKVVQVLKTTTGISSIVMAHCETSTGMLLPWEELVASINTLPKGIRPTLIADASSTFGATDVSWGKDVDYFITSPNKCLQGIPGFGFIIFKKESALAAQNIPKRTLSLDFISQSISMNQTGQFRFTPPTHALVGTARALLELEKEGGWQARQKRFQETKELLVTGLKSLGFSTFLPDASQNHLYTSFTFPPPPFNWDKFFFEILARDVVLYPSNHPERGDVFMVSSMGHFSPEDVEKFLSAVSEVKRKLKF